jgi:hypothetical protein
VNKKLIAFIPILFLFLSLPLIPVNASTKAGGTCSKAGFTSVVSGKTYTCIKSGKKLVWGKGVAVAAPTPVKEKAKTFPSIAPIKSADYPLVGALAKDTILNQKATVHNPFVINWDPTTTELKRNLYFEQIEIIKKYFSPMIPNNSTAEIFIFGSSKEWADEVLRNTEKKYSDTLFISKRYRVSSNCASTPEGALILDNEFPADYTYYRGAGGGLPVLGAGYGMVATANCDTKYLERDLLIHETFHAIQWIYASHKFDSKEAIKLPSLKGTSPMWMAEGSATYMGYLLSADSNWTSFGEDKRQFILDNNGLWNKSYEEFAADALVEAYSIGAVMYEYLLAKYGLERTLSFWPEAINSLKPIDITNFPARIAASKVAFQRVFGLSVEDFFIEVKPYTAWSLEQARRVP